MAAECIWSRESELGEGARYDPDTNSIWWVDILGQRIMNLDLVNGRKREWETPTHVGTTFANMDGSVLALLRHNLCTLDLETGTFDSIVEFRDEPATNRFNDGTVGPDGRIWLGSMDFDCERPTGALYCVEADGSVAVKDTGYTVTNGPAVSADGNRLFVNETMSRNIFCFDRDPQTNILSNKRLFAQPLEDEGLPDGLCVDTDGGLWVALVTGGKVRRYKSDGHIDFDLQMPTPIVTSVVLGGLQRQTLFVTTGRILLSDTDLADYPASGSLFQIDVDFEGPITPTAKMLI